MTQRRVQALKWMIAYLLWFFLFFDSVVSRASMEVYLFITLVVLLVVRMIQAKG